MTSRKSIVGAVSVGLALAWGTARARADVPITVPVSPGTDVGVGFGELSPGAHSLEITLEASGDYVITRSNWADPSGEHVWTPAEITEAGQQHVYTVYGVFSNDAHAVKFRGFLGRGPGQGPPPVFDVAVGDIDLDIDSDNDSTAEYRPASGTQAEDEAEYVGSSTPTSECSAMGMSIGENWAKMALTANVKKAGKILVTVSSVQFSLQSPQWSFADESFNALTPRAGEGGYVVLFEEDAAAGSFERTLYFKPNEPYASVGDVLTLTATISTAYAGGESQSQPKPTDRTNVEVQAWTLGGSTNKTVIVDADDVYSDIMHEPAIMKSFVVRPPAGLPAGQRYFRIKRTHPGGEQSRLRVMYMSSPLGGLTDVNFQNDLSEVLPLQGDPPQARTFFVRGVPVARSGDPDPWGPAAGYASTNHGDQGLDLYPCNEQGTIQEPPAKRSSGWTALWVTLSIKSQGTTVSTDNASYFQYLVTFHAEAQSRALGPVGNGLEGEEPVWRSSSIGQAVEICGTVYPADLPDQLFTWKRWVRNGSAWRRRPLQQPEPIWFDWEHMDECAGEFGDERQRSGSSINKIYDIDIPGAKVLCVASDETGKSRPVG